MNEATQDSKMHDNLYALKKQDFFTNYFNKHAANNCYLSLGR